MMEDAIVSKKKINDMGVKDKGKPSKVKLY
jgi:hypothetical protein